MPFTAPTTLPPDEPENLPVHSKQPPCITYILLLHSDPGVRFSDRGKVKELGLPFRTDSGHIGEMETDSHIALFEMDGPFLLPLPAILALTEKARSNFLGSAAWILGSDALPEDISGHDALRAPLGSSHTHLHVFGLASNPLLGFKYMGFWKHRPFTAQEKDAFLTMNDLHDSETGSAWAFEPVFAGSLEDSFEIMPSGLERYFKPSRTWVSATPFLKSRHLRVRRSEKHDSDAYRQAIAREIAGNVRFELLNRSFPEPESILLRSDHLIGSVAEGIPCAHFVRTRKVARGQSLDYGHSLVITFKEPVKGPILLGKHAHFGMGLFASP